ncbi:MAG: chitobiase/beta-hexosaminidase C-terminal domain-containing protein [Terracidiphilus sp.]|jgi:stage V sporulation protein SpoVS
MGTTELLLKALKNPLLARTSLPGISFDFKTSHAVGVTVRTNLAIKLVIGLLVLCAAGSAYSQSCSGISLGTNASLNGFVPFPSSNVWNTNIASAPVDPNSAAITSASGFAGFSLHPDFGSESIYGIPYVVVDSTLNPSVPIDVIDYADQSDVVVAPYPITAPIEGSPADCSGWPDTYNGDAHVLVLDRAKCVLYETFNTNRCNGQWNASSETVWNMSNYETRPWGWTSADAAGLPIFPGLVRYDEIASGAINHAIRFTMQQTKDDNNGGYFVYPATHAAGNLWGSMNVMGMRIRLKASFDISGFSPVNQIILKAMQQYGMILADNGSYFYFQGVSDPRFDDDDLNNLKSIASSNFEVVQATPEFPGYDSETAPGGASPEINSFTASASKVSSGSPVTLNYSVSGDSYDYIDVIGPVAAGSGSVTVNPTATQTYTLNSTNAYGRTTSAPITVTVPGSVVVPPVFTPPAGPYTTTQSVTLSSATSPSATIYYTTDGSTPTTGSTVFSISNPIVVSPPETVKAIATATGYAAPSAVASATYSYGASPAATPVFSIAAGTYTSAQSVTISDATPGSRICYTTNGSAPTSSSTQYTGAIAVSSSETIHAIAVAAGYTVSSTATATYTIIPPVAPAPAFSVSAGTYTSPQAIIISDAIPGAAIYYTFDGTTPTTSSSQYAGSIAVSVNTTVQAIAVAAGYTNSAAASSTYIINKPPCATPVFSVSAGTYNSPQSVTLSDATRGVMIYYTTDGTTPTGTSTYYTGPISITGSQTINAIATSRGYSPSAVASATYAITALPPD